MIEGQKLRDELAGDYKRAYERLGADISFESLQSLASSDLHLVDKAHDDIAPTNSTKGPASLIPASRPRAEPTSAEQMAEDLGGKMIRREIPEEAPNPMQTQSVRAIIGERHTALVNRLARMLQCEPTTKRYKSIMDRPFVHSRFALDVLAQHADFTFRRRGYRGLSERDANRRFWRKIEDIADRSTGALGPWWVR